MTESSSQTPRPQPPEELHWGISYLREDIQDLRQEMRDNTQEVRQEIQGVRQEMRDNTQEVRQEIREEVRLLHSRMDALNTSLSTRIDDRYELLLKRIDSRFAWTLTTVIAGLRSRFKTPIATQIAVRQWFKPGVHLWHAVQR